MTSIALKLLEEIGSIWLFDCGEATQHQILRTTIKPRKIDKIFITHMHGDHIFGLPGFLSSRSFLGGDTPLTIYGPAELQPFVQAALTLSRTHLTYPVHFVTVTEGIVFEDDLFIVHARLLEHVIPCFGYRIEQKPLPGQLLIERVQALGVPRGPLYRDLKNGLDVTLADGTVILAEQVVSPPKPGFTVAILGDTKYCEASKLLAQKADIVVHEATFDHTTTELAASYGHATNREAAAIAKEAQAQHLILTHISARFVAADLHVLVKEACHIFPSTYMAADFGQFTLKNGQLVME